MEKQTKLTPRSGIVLITILLLLLPKLTLAHSHQQPNFLLIIADDLGVDILKSYNLGKDVAHTPNLDRLAKNGLVFDNFWVTPACTTTRGALITGQHGFESNIDYVPAEIEAGTITLQSRLKQDDLAQPYSTGVFGKWHLAGRNNDVNHPAQFGIDQYAGNLVNLKNYNQWTMTKNGKQSNVNQYHTTTVTNQTIDFIQQSKHKPWFAWVAYSAPHIPFHQPPSDLTSSKHNGGSVSEQYRAMVEAMDTEIGRLLSSLSKQDRANTIIAFLGDNGSPRRVRDAAVFDATYVKGSLYEGGIRAPLIISGSAVTRKGQREAALVNATDFFATFVELAGAHQSPHKDIPRNSVSFTGLLNNTGTGKRTYNYSEWRKPRGEPSWAVSNGKYKVIQHEDGYTELFATSDLRELAPLNQPQMTQTLLAVGETIRSGKSVVTSKATPMEAVPNAASTAPSFSIVIRSKQRCFVGDGLPNHNTGEFPTRGNPNKIQRQTINLCVDAVPVKNSSPNMNHRGSVGIALNGIQFRPATADYYDQNGRRGFSRDRSSGWNLEGIGASDLLGMDHNNAHVDNRGLYHYHAVADALLTDNNSLIGYAADGHEIHYVGDKQTSSYVLRSGNRATAPGGKHDGLYVEDWVYKKGSGSLDQCNAGELNGKFVYFATDTFPFFPRCFWGNISQDFSTRHQAQQQNGQNGNRQPNQQQGRRNNQQNNFIPPRALEACQGVKVGNTCEFVTRRNVEREGTCQQVQEKVTACVSQRRR